MVEVAVVGAGPAGLISAQILASRGCEVSVIEKDTNPGEMKPCGGMLRIEAARAFKIPSQLAYRQIKGIRVVLPDHNVEEVDYPHVISLNLDRGALGEYLVDRVRKLGGEVNTGSKVVDVSASRESGTTNYELKCVASDGKTRTVKTEMLIAADGINSIVVKKTGVRQQFEPNQLGLCVQYQIRLENNLIEKRIGDRNEVYYGHDVAPFGYAWIAPKHNLVTVGVGALLSMVNTNLKKYLEYFVRRHPVSSWKLEGGKILKFETALCPLSGLISPTFGDSLILAGDAAGHCSPISGEGIYYSMVAGRIAGEVSLRAIKIGDLSARYLRKYERSWRKAFGSDLRWGRWFQRIANRRGFMSGTFNKSTPVKARLSERLADILAGIRPYKKTLLKALPEFIIAKMIP